MPVIRVFGATETGQKVCAHIHGAFPYLFVEYTGSVIPDDGIVSKQRICSLTDLIQWAHTSIDFTFQSILL